MLSELDILGIGSRSATIADVREAYKVQALRYHPDRPGGNAEMFKRVQRAYTNLCAALDQPASTISAATVEKPPPARKPSGSFMKPTASSAAAQEPRVKRAATSTKCPPSTPITGNRSQKNTVPSTAARTFPDFLGTIYAPELVQRPDLSNVLLDTDQRSFRLAGAAHLRRGASVRRKTDGMWGRISGVLPATGVVFWCKEGSQFAVPISGSPSEYVVAESAAATPSSPIPGPTSTTNPTAIFKDPLVGVVPSVFLDRRPPSAPSLGSSNRFESSWGSGTFGSPLTNTPQSTMGSGRFTFLPTAAPSPTSPSPFAKAGPSVSIRSRISACVTTTQLIELQHEVQATMLSAVKAYASEVYYLFHLRFLPFKGITY